MHRSSFSRHDSFFSSLSQVEKRLESEEAEEVEPPSSFPSSSSSPLFLLSNDPEPIHHEATANAGSSEPPLDFLSNSPTNTNTQFQQQQQQQQQAPDDDGDDHQVEDDIDHLVSLLGLSLPPHQNDYYSSCDCSCSQGGGGGGFFRKVVGVKGPRCGKEMERLDAWIDTLYPSSSQSKSKSKREPARLAHLLLGKAAALALNDGGGDGFGAVGFPATVHDFLDHDPPPPQEKQE